jgi:4,4'-diaponeurosporenoate glycosyltransferase
MLVNFSIIFIGFIVSFILFNKFPTLTKSTPTIKPKVSIIVPARNEENNIENIISDLKLQDYDIHEIICVDDNSTDSTARIIKKHDVKYLLVNSLPKGWKGKPWACQNGAKLASGDLLLFIDSDVRLHKSAISSLVAHYEKVKTPISVQPFHIVKTPHEYLSLFFNFIQVCVTYLSIFNKRKYVGFYGPIFLVERVMFLKNGGYENAKDDVVEDLFLGKYYNSKNIDIDLLLGGPLIQFTMYPKSLSQLLEGWSKNFSKASLSIKPSLFLMVFLWIGFLTALPFELISSYKELNFYYFGILVLIYILTVLKLFINSRHIGSFPFFVSLFYPFYLLAFFLIFLYSVFCTYLFKTTTWKGRRLYRSDTCK